MLRSFEEALALVREQFPDRTISGFYADDNFRIVEDFSAVIIARNLPKSKPLDLPRDPRGVPEEWSLGWCNSLKSDDQSLDPQTVETA